MPFREKSAWISLACLLATFGVFFFSMIHGVIEPSGFRSAHLFFVAFVVFFVLQIILHVIAAAMAPKEANTPADERERRILLAAGRNAHLVLIAGVILTPLTLHLGLGGPAMAYHLMMALVVSEIVRSVSQIVYFRRGG
ncbi:MAG: hypothetical protein JWM33_1031 [Caulobacteraceae bacterium]|nr:hypothetical protein [Caulobacteraceae bacterium]